MNHHHKQQQNPSSKNNSTTVPKLWADCLHLSYLGVVISMHSTSPQNVLILFLTLYFKIKMPLSF